MPLLTYSFLSLRQLPSSLKQELTNISVVEAHYLPAAAPPLPQEFATQSTSPLPNYSFESPPSECALSGCFRSAPPSQEFAARELRPHAARWDEEKHFPVDTLRSAAGLGFAGLFCREDVGGTG